MTLDTRIYALDPVDVRETFLECNRLIGAHEGIKWSDHQIKTWRNGVGTPQPGNAWNIGNNIGQGLCALLDIYYRPDAPLRAADNGCAWYCDPGCQEEHENPACWLEVSFDTAYGYTGANGESCSVLHARLVAQLGNWFDARGVRWKWRNEFTCELFDGYDGLENFANDGGRARDWFTSSVLPLIQGGVR